MKPRIGQAVEVIGMPHRVGYVQGWHIADKGTTGTLPQDGIFYVVTFADESNDNLRYHVEHIFTADQLTDAGYAEKVRRQKYVNRVQNNTVKGRIREEL